MKLFQIDGIYITRTYQVINLFRNMIVLENVIVGMHSQLETNFVDSLLHEKQESEERNNQEGGTLSEGE